ncbi:MAG: hypothetical protein KBG83_00950 [Bacteroidetes bacterium]|nr:hypothetical protein [Bacteroidota bacterium]
MNKKINRTQISWIVLILALVSLLLFFILKLSTKTQSKKLPEKLGNLHLLETQRGEEAKKLFSTVYLLQNNPQSYAVYHYGAAEGLSRIFVLSYSNEQEAAKSFDIIEQDIESHNTSFTHSRKFEYAKKTVYLFLGFGKAHYLLFDKNNLIWVESDIPIAQVTITKLLDFLYKQ